MNFSKTKTPKLRFPGFNDEWEEKKLGNIANFSKGIGISKSDIVEGGKTKAIRYGELYTAYGEVIDEVVSSTNSETKNLVLSKKNDVIIPASGETHVDIATASCVLSDGVALSGDLNIIRADSHGVFLSYYLNNVKKLDIARLSQGVSVVHLYPASLKLLKLNLPAIDEQKKIAGFLSTVDEKIAALQAKKELFEKYKKGIMQKIFPAAGKTTPELRFPGFTDPWQKKKLGQVFKERSEKGGINKNMLSVTISNGIVPFSDTDRKDNSSSDKSNYKHVEIGDIAYNSMRMWQGASGVSIYSGIVSPAYTVITPKSTQIPNFWGYYFKLTSLIFTFQRYSQGLTSDTWNLKFRQLAEIMVGVPIIEEQQKIAEFLTNLDNKIEVAERKLEQAKQFKKALLQQMFV